MNPQLYTPNHSKTEQDYEKLTNTLAQIDMLVLLFGGLLVLVLFFIFASFLYKIKRRERFEMTILIFNSLKYANWTIYALFSDKIDGNRSLQIISQILFDSTGPISHWAYASQYMQTCILIPGLVYKAQLLMERHRDVIMDEYKLTTATDIFVKKHKEIDEDIEA